MSPAGTFSINPIIPVCPLVIMSTLHSESVFGVSWYSILVYLSDTQLVNFCLQAYICMTPNIDCC